MNVQSAVSSRLALQRFFARTDFVPSKTSISRRSRPGSAAPFKDSRPDTLAFMLSTLSTNGTRSPFAIQIQRPSTQTYPVYVRTGIRRYFGKCQELIANVEIFLDVSG